MNTDNKITGPGYYPRRPTRWMCLAPAVDIPSHMWYGWHSDLTIGAAERSLGLEEYVFVLAPVAEVADARGRQLYTAADSLWDAHYMSPIESSFNHSHFQSCLDARSVALHWPDGSWRIYRDRVATAQQGFMKPVMP